MAGYRPRRSLGKIDLGNGATLSLRYDITRLAYNVHYMSRHDEPVSVYMLVDDSASSVEFFKSFGPFISSLREQYVIELASAAWQQ